MEGDLDMACLEVVKAVKASVIVKLPLQTRIKNILQEEKMDNKQMPCFQETQTIECKKRQELTVKRKIHTILHFLMKKMRIRMQRKPMFL